MTTSWDTVNLTLGIFGVLALIPTIAKFIKSKLPSSRLNYFDKLVTETEDLILSLEEQGTFREPITTAHFRKRLSSVRQEAELPRMQTYCATSLWQQLQGLCNGLSKKLSDLCVQARRLRAEISQSATEELNRASDAGTSSSGDEALEIVSPVSTGTTGAISDGQSEHASAIMLPSAELSGPSASSTTADTSPAVIPSPSCKPMTSPSDIPHLGDPIHVDISRRPKTRRKSLQFMRRNKRYLASRSLSSLTIAQMEHRKSGVMRSDDFKRVLRTGTFDSISSSSTCVSESDSLPTSMKLQDDQSVREHEVQVSAECGTCSSNLVVCPATEHRA